MKTLVITADNSVGTVVSIGLQLRWPDMQVSHTTDAAQGWALFCQTAPDLILLDGNLPRHAGWDLLRRMRTVSTTPIILLLARGAELDRARGLEAGAADYLALPFSHLELFARIQAVLRRAGPPPAPAPASEAVAGGGAGSSEAGARHTDRPADSGAIHPRHRHPPSGRRRGHRPGRLLLPPTVAPTRPMPAR
jgi:DNA-binding response OmpR family regulator